MSHSTHCARVMLLQLSNPISTFITLLQPQNLPTMSASQFLTFAAPNFSPTLSQHIWNENLNHSMILSLKFIRRTYGRPFFLNIWPPAITSKLYHMLTWDSIHFLKPSFLSLFRGSCILPLAFCFLGQCLSDQVTYAVRLTLQAVKSPCISPDCKIYLHILILGFFTKPEVQWTLLSSFQYTLTLKNPKQTGRDFS